ncbi:putative DNA primase/polymerase [Serratia phage vB_SmaS_Opt-169]|nr:putative DNA primase/polymerase [Serratia phage vB_SmaS_Opt-169]
MSNKAKAIEYAKVGLKLIPLWWINSEGVCACGDALCIGTNQGKHPIASLVKTALKEATSDLEKIEKWWTKYPNANIGMACRASGLFVVDVDLHDENKNGFESLDDWETTFDDKIKSKVSQDTGGGGQHIFFRMPEGLSTAPSGMGKNYPGVDFKFNGYVLLSPSNHKSGNKYEWSDDKSEENLLSGKVPPLPRSIVKFISDGQDGKNKSPERYSAPARVQDDDDVNQMRDALNCMSFFGMDDDERLKVGMGLQQVLPGGVGKSLYFDWLSQNLGSKFNIKLSERRWRSFKFRPGGRTIASFYEVAARFGFINEGKRGTFINPDDYVYMEPTLVKKAYVESSNIFDSMFVIEDAGPSMTVDQDAEPPVMAVDMYAQASPDYRDPSNPNFTFEPAEFKGDSCMNELFNAVNKIATEEKDFNKGMPTPAQWDEWKSRLSNNKTLFSIFKYQVENNSSFVPELALGFTLSVFGGLMSGRFKVDDVTTNLYVLIVAPSSIGKSQTIGMMSKIFSFTGDHNRFGPKDIVSDKGFYNDLIIDRARMFPLDEIGELFGTIFGPRANPSQAAIKRAILDGFSAFSIELNKTASKASAKDSPVVNLGRISPSIFGVTTPAKIWQAFSGRDIVDGFLNRMFLLNSEAIHPIGKLSMKTELPREFIDWFYAIRSRWQQNGIMPVSNSDTCTELKIAPDAKIYLDAIKDIETRNKNASEKYGLIWGRLTEITIRIAIIFELTERPFSSQVNKDSIQAAFQLVHWSLSNTDKVARTKIADSEEESIMKEVYEKVVNSPRGIFYSELTESTRLAGNLRLRAQILSALKDEQKIKEYSFAKKGQRGRPKKLYLTPENYMNLPHEIKEQLKDLALEI